MKFGVEFGVIMLILPNSQHWMRQISFIFLTTMYNCTKEAGFAALTDGMSFQVD